MKNKKRLLTLLALACVLTSGLALGSCNGPQGEQGVGIEKVEYDENGDLKITFTDGTTQTVEMPEKEEEGTYGLQYQRIAGKDEYCVTGIGIAAELDIVIPDTYNGLPVTEISERAFNAEVSPACALLTSVTIGKNVTSIGEDAFYNCSSLKSVYITDIAAWCNISFGNYSANPLAYGDNLYLNNELVTKLIIPDSVTTIGNVAFYNCSSLTSVTIGNGVTSIGYRAFRDCSSLTFNEYGNCKYLGNESNPYLALIFAVNTNYNSYTIHENTKVIANSAFSDCTRLTSITIPDSVTTIGASAFSSCSSLTSITIPDSVTTIGNSAFLYCSRLTSITIPDSVTSIGNSAFRYCSSLTSITIPDSVTSIGNLAFRYCSSLTSVTIGDSVTSIGDWAFSDCINLTSITFNGTMAEWRAITNGSSWNSEVPATEVICSDGKFAL